MKLSRLLLVLTLAVIAAMWVAVAKADGLPPGDPIARTAGDPPLDGEVPEGIFTTSFAVTCVSGTCPAIPNDGSSPCVLTQGPFSESSPSCFFQNDIAINGQPQFIDSLILDLPNVSPDSVNPGDAGCTIPGQPVLFTSCNVGSDGSGGSVVFFTGGTIQFGQAFFLDLEGFTGGVNASAYAQLPEPSTVLLLGIGLVALLGFSRKRVLGGEV